MKLRPKTSDRPAARGSGRFRVGEFVVEPSLNRLCCGRRTLSVESKVMEVLVCLASRAGEVVTKEQLLAEVWPNTAVSDEAIWHAISQLRRALGDDSRASRFIDTVPKRGYRLIAPTLPHATAEPAAPTRRPVLELLLVAVVALAAARLGVWYWDPGDSTERVFLIERRVTGRPGSDRLGSCALSPDGRYLASADRQGLWVQLVNGTQVLRLPTPGVSRIRRLAWMPDSGGVVFTGRRDERDALLSMPIYGTGPRVLATGAEDPSVSPDGSRLVFLRRAGREIWVSGVDGGNPMLVVSHAGDRFSDPAWSPDSRSLAYWRGHGITLRHSVEVLELESGARRAVYTDIEEADLKWRALFWSGSGRLFLSYPRLTPQFSATLWEVDPAAAAGEQRRVYHFADSFPLEFSVSDAGVIAVLKAAIQADLSLGEVAGGRLVRQRRLTADSFFDWPSGWSHDGTTVLFHSNRGGEWDAFAQSVDGGPPRRLAAHPGGQWWPRPSRDGRWILFWANNGRGLVPDAETLMRVPADGGVASQVLVAFGATNRFDCPTGGARPCVLSRESPGAVVFSAFDPDGGPGPDLARIESDAGAHGHSWDLTSDGRRLVVVAGSPAGEITILDLEDGTTARIPAPPGQHFYAASWSPDGDLVYAAVGLSYVEQKLAVVTPQGDIRQLVDDSPEQHWLSAPLAAPDGHSLLYAELSLRSNAWLLEPGGGELHDSPDSGSRSPRRPRRRFPLRRRTASCSRNSICPLRLRNS